MTEGASYNELLKEFQVRVYELEQDSLELDCLAKKLDEGFALLETLRTKLTEAQAKVEEVIRMRHKGN